MKKAILTGATGFVGKWLIKILLEADVDVTVIVRDKNKLDMNFVDKIHIYECEYYNYDTLEISASKYDVFYHLAWDGVASKDKDKLDI